ncbi:hypothetical protein QYF36_000958 [Acer negundo]|nr:hypothetical protein QYF36_000958 [Acer negundo]
MDAKVSVLILMKKLPVMFPTIGDSIFGEQIKNNPQSLNQLLRYAEDSEVTCVGDGGGDSLVEDDNDQKTARILQALYSAVCALHWKSKSLNRLVSPCGSSLCATSSVNDYEDVMNCNGQRWGRISRLCEETDVVVCIRQETTNKLLVRLAAQHEFNEGQYTGEIVKKVRVNGDQQDIGLVSSEADFAGVETLSAEYLAWKITKLLDATRFFTVLDDANTFEVWKLF